MLYYAIVFFILAVIAGFLEFKNVGSDATKIAKVFSSTFLVLALLVVLSATPGISLFV